MKEIENLEKALSAFLKSKDAAALAGVLHNAEKNGSISYEEVDSLVPDDAEDILLLAFQWRLLLPVRASKAGDWEDRMMIPQIGERYTIPNVVRYLIKNAQENGEWNPEKAITDVFTSIAEPDVDKMTVLFERMVSEMKGHRIKGTSIKNICSELGLVSRVDPLVSELKACGILSHKLSSLTEVSRAGAPLYEVNPSLLVG
jgi:hypothetical protein